MSSHREAAEPLHSADASLQPDGQADAIELLTIDDLEVEGRRVLLRADLDVPLTSAATGIPVRLPDGTRIRAALTTIDELRMRGARLVLLSHLSRPHGYDAIPSMRPVADRLAELTGVPVALAPGVIGSRVRALTEQLEPRRRP